MSGSVCSPFFDFLLIAIYCHNLMRLGKPWGRWGEIDRARESFAVGILRPL